MTKDYVLGTSDTEMERLGFQHQVWQVETAQLWRSAGFGYGQRLLDLGCGPGLYTSQFAGLGAEVTGIDISDASLAHAEAEAKAAGQQITYLHDDYTRTTLPADTDVFTLISCDFGPLSPDQRRALLGKIHAALKPGGRFVLDVQSMTAFERFAEHDVVEFRLMDGFWSEGDYVGLLKSIKYRSECVSLDRYLIIEPDDHWEIYNWLQYFSRESLERELRAAGFEPEVVAGSLVGDPWREDSDVFAVIARAV